MFAALRRAVALALPAASVPAFALASLYADAVETAVFRLCPALRTGSIAPERPALLTRLGYRRMAEAEEDLADAEDGVPFIFVRGGEADAIRLAYWPYPRLCSVTFGGEEGEAAVAQVKARILRHPRLYRRVAAATWSSDAGRHEAWRVVRRVPLCLSIDSPAAEEDPPSYDVSYEPLRPVQPAIAISACAPARAPQPGHRAR